MDELIKKFNININRIKRANIYFKNNNAGKKAENELNIIIDDCNKICTELLAKGYDITKLNMDIT